MSGLVIPTRLESREPVILTSSEWREPAILTSIGWREPVILTSFGRPGEEGSAGGFLVARRDHAPRNDRTTGRHS